MYLDEQSGQLPGRNLDVYAADIERIEVLEGPQGTLFGSGAAGGRAALHHQQAEARRDRGRRRTPATAITARRRSEQQRQRRCINLPLIPDTLAVRAVIYNDSRGGYINNVPATFTRSADRRRLRCCTTAACVPDQQRGRSTTTTWSPTTSTR